MAVSRCLSVKSQTLDSKTCTKNINNKIWHVIKACYFEDINGILCAPSPRAYPHLLSARAPGRAAWAHAPVEREGQGTWWSPLTALCVCRTQTCVEKEKTFREKKRPGRRKRMERNNFRWIRMATWREEKRTFCHNVFVKFSPEERRWGCLGERKRDVENRWKNTIWRRKKSNSSRTDPI